MKISKARNRDYHALRQAALDARGTPEGFSASFDFAAHCKKLEADYPGFDAMADDVAPNGDVLKGEQRNTVRQMIAERLKIPFRTRQRDLRERVRKKNREE